MIESSPRDRGRMLVGCTALALGLTAACRGDQPKESIELVVPDGSGRTYELVPRSAFAEYVEVPEVTNELRVTLATHDVSCERYVAPGPDDTVLVVTLRMPPNDKPRPGSFATTPPLADDAGANAVSRAYAVPLIRRKERGYALPAGGSMELSLVDLGRSGRVSGSLAFEFPGDATRPASSAKGKFTARLCRSEEAPVAH